MEAAFRGRSPARSVIVCNARSITHPGTGTPDDDNLYWSN